MGSNMGKEQSSLGCSGWALVVYLAAVCLIGVGVVGAPLPRVLDMNCREDAVLVGERSVNAPPNDKCWGWYPSHVYPVFLHTGEPVDIAAVSAKVTGGISELGIMVEGFKLQVVRGTSELLACSIEDDERLIAAAEDAGWETILEFAVPCAAGNTGKVVSWYGLIEDVVAVRILAPYGKYVDNSALWIEY